jgi:hypothetical protein
MNLQQNNITQIYDEIYYKLMLTDFIYILQKYNFSSEIHNHLFKIYEDKFIYNTRSHLERNVSDIESYKYSTYTISNIC